MVQRNMVVLAVLMSSLVAGAAPPVEVTGFGSNPGGLRLFVHVPPTLPARAPLVVVLHGCSQTANDAAGLGWDGLADRHGFLVAYPQVASNASCFDWASAAQQVRSGPQVTSVLQMVESLWQQHGLDASRVYVTGLSAGGAMTNVLLAVAPDIFAGGAVFAGVAFQCATSQLGGLTCMSGPPVRSASQWGDLVRAVAGTGTAPRVQLWHGSVDGTVSPSNLDTELAQWTDVNGIDATADDTASVATATRRRFLDGAGQVRVETWLVSGMGHGTPVAPPGCGQAGAFAPDMGVCGAEQAAAFFGLVPSSGADGGTGGGAGGGAGGSGSGGGGGGGGQPGGCGAVPGGVALWLTLGLLGRASRSRVDAQAGETRPHHAPLRDP